MIICCGEALIDMVPEGKGFLPCPGGGSYNTALAIGRLGVEARFLGRISRDFFGETLVKRLEDSGVGTELIVRSAEHSTLAFVKLEPGKEPQYVFYTEGSADRSLRPEDLPPTLPEGARCILFGSISMTMEPVARTIEGLVRRESRGTNAPVVAFDPNIRPFMIPDRGAYLKRFDGWLGLSTIVKISAEDFNFIYPGLGPEAALEKALGMGPVLGICTLGPEGALALLRRDDGRILRVKAPAVDLPVTDTIGAGDTFQGALLAALERAGKMSRRAIAALTEAELYGALFFANKAASLVCSRRGAEPPALAEVEALGEADRG
jgi:fructokinase